MANQYNMMTDPLADAGGENSKRNGAQTEIDFGSTPVADSTFTILDPLVTSTSQIIAQQVGTAATGKDADENEMDQLLLVATPANGSISLYARATDHSYLAGAFLINYRRA